MVSAAPIFVGIGLPGDEIRITVGERIPEVLLYLFKIPPLMENTAGHISISRFCQTSQ